MQFGPFIDAVAVLTFIANTIIVISLELVTVAIFTAIGLGKEFLTNLPLEKPRHAPSVIVVTRLTQLHTFKFVIERVEKVILEN